jgi:uncharacterized cupin superfamily protein
MRIVRTTETPWTEGINQGKFSQRRKDLGGKAFAAGLWELPPGKKSFPFHMHHVTDEALFVVAGSAKVRTPEGEVPIHPGDYVSFPPGEGAHQLINDGAEALVYLAVSVSKGVDIVEYPDSGRVSSSLGTWPNLKRFMFNAKDGVGYFDGEKDAEP